MRSAGKHNRAGPGRLETASLKPLVHPPTPQLPERLTIVRNERQFLFSIFFSAKRGFRRHFAQFHFPGPRCQPFVPLYISFFITSTPTRLPVFDFSREKGVSRDVVLCATAEHQQQGPVECAQMYTHTLHPAWFHSVGQNPKRWESNAGLTLPTYRSKTKGKNMGEKSQQLDPAKEREY